MTERGGAGDCVRDELQMNKHQFLLVRLCTYFGFDFKYLIDKNYTNKKLEELHIYPLKHEYLHIFQKHKFLMHNVEYV